MSNDTNAPAPDANDRLDLPAPKPAERIGEPRMTPQSEPSPVVSISSAAGKLTEKTPRPTNHIFALVFGIASFLLSAIPFLGILLGAFSVVIALRGLINNKAKKKFFVWAVVLSGLGTLAALSYTASFISYLSSH